MKNYYFFFIKKINFYHKKLNFKLCLFSFNFINIITCFRKTTRSLSKLFILIISIIIFWQTLIFLHFIIFIINTSSIITMVIQIINFIFSKIYYVVALIIIILLKILKITINWMHSFIFIILPKLRIILRQKLLIFLLRRNWFFFDFLRIIINLLLFKLLL